MPLVSAKGDLHIPNRQFVAINPIASFDSPTMTEIPFLKRWFHAKRRGMRRNRPQNLH
jgi:hypothetical protein